MKKLHFIRLPGENRGPEYLEAPKYWMCSLASLTPPPFGRPGEVYPDENRGRNDVKQHQTNFSTASGDEGERAKEDNAPSPHPSPLPTDRQASRERGNSVESMFFFLYQALYRHQR